MVTYVNMHVNVCAVIVESVNRNSDLVKPDIVSEVNMHVTVCAVIV